MGNVGSRDVQTIDEQPEEGFESETEAEKHLLELIEKRQGIFFTRPWYKFTILKTYSSKNALDLIGK